MSDNVSDGSGVGVPPDSPSEPVGATPTGASNTKYPDYGRIFGTVIAGERHLSEIHAASEAFVSKQPRFTSSATNGSRRSPTFYARAGGLPVCAAPRPANADREYTTIVVPPGDKRIATARFKAAATNEIDGQNARVIFSKVKECDLPNDANVLSGRLVWTLNNLKTPEEAPKACFAAQGHRH